MKGCFSQSLQHFPDLVVYYYQLKIYFAMAYLRFAGIGISQGEGWEKKKKIYIYIYFASDPGDFHSQPGNM